MTNAIYFLNYFDIHIEYNTIQTFRIWNWLLFFCIGGYIKYQNLQFNIKPLIIVCVFVLNLIFQALNIKFINSTYCEFFYSNLIVQILSVIIMGFILSLNINYSKSINLLSNLFLPVYTIHIFVIPYVDKFLNSINVSFVECKALYAMLFSIIISVILSWIVMKFPLSNKIFKI